MKYALTLIAGYYLPSITQHISLDVCLGIAAGVLFGLLVAMLFIGPTPTPAPKVQSAKVAKVRKPRRIIEHPAPKEWTFTPINYEWSAA